MVGVVGSNPIAPTNYFESRLSLGDWMRTKFDKIAGSDFERAQHGPEGGGQDARSNPIAPTNSNQGRVTSCEGRGTRLNTWSRHSGKCKAHIRNPEYWKRLNWMPDRVRHDGGYFKGLGCWSEYLVKSNCDPQFKPGTGEEGRG
jgi:hypothetical protein